MIEQALRDFAQNWIVVAVLATFGGAALGWAVAVWLNRKDEGR